MVTRDDRSLLLVLACTCACGGAPKDDVSATLDDAATARHEAPDQRAELAKVDRAVAETRKTITDATKIAPDAAAPMMPVPRPVDPSALPLLAVTDHDRGEETQVLAADADADDLFVQLWPASDPVIARSTGKDITGQLVAPSRLAAGRSIAAAAGISPTPIAAHTHSIAVNVEFSKVDQRELFNLIADTLRVNIVIAPATLPDVDIIARRVSATDVMAGLAALDVLAIVRQANIDFVVPRGYKLPALAPRASQQISLYVYGGTAQQAVAAIGAVVPVPLHSCDTTTFRLRLRNVSVAEALRAIAVASGTTLDLAAHCPIADADKPGASPTLAVVARSGVKTAAVIVSAGVAGVVHKSGTTDIGTSYVTINGTTIQPTSQWSAPPDDDRDYPAWLARLQRTRAIVRIGTRWMARVDTTDGRAITIHSDQNPGAPDVLMTYPPVIDASGVELVAADHRAKKRIPLASK